MWATVLHLTHVTALVEYSLLHPWQTMIGHPVCCLVGLILISVCVPHSAGQSTRQDVAVSCVLVSPFHPRRVEPVPPRDNQGLQCLSVEVVDHRNVDRNAGPSVTTQLRDEIESWLLPRNGVLRRIALHRGRAVEECSVLEMVVINSYVPYHPFHDTYQSSHSWAVSSLLTLHVSLEILRNAVSRGGLKVDQELNRHDSAVIFLLVLLIYNLHPL